VKKFWAILLFFTHFVFSQPTYLCSIIASEKASKQKLPNFEAGIKVNFSIAIGKMVAQNIS